MLNHAPICVESEIGLLKKVLLHRPGAELEQLVPDNLRQLLFDDIPYLKAAQKEHDQFAQVLQEQGAEVLYLEDLMTETIAQDSDIKEQFVRDFIEESGSVSLCHKDELRDMLLGCESDKELVLKTMTGTSFSELSKKTMTPLAERLGYKPQFVMEPIPNLYFTRDPFATIGGGVSVNRMYSRTRIRETIYGRYILTYHPDYRQKVPFYYHNSEPFSIEGGDILNLSSHVLGVGISQRTSPEAVDLLAKRLFSDPSSKIDTIIVFDIPALRAFMHLDTVFTQMDFDKFTIHPEIIEPLKLYVLRKKNSRGDYSVDDTNNDLGYTLSKELDIDKAVLINCGGRDRVISAREQWNDGANTLCVEPGKVIVYERNYVTNQMLEEYGVTVLQVPSSELSRGRGGPRCMSMPFVRQALS